MRKSTIVMIAFAVVFGLLAVFVAQSWLNSEAEKRMKSLERAARSRSHADASWSRRSRCGSATSSRPAHLREMAWPEAALPNGSFAKISDVLNGGKRIVLTAIEPNEPVLRSKITGPGQRATLSAMLRDGMQGRRPCASTTSTASAASCCRAIASMSC